MSVSPAATRAAYPSRLVGVDLARLLALLGMFAAHLVVTHPGEGPGGVDTLFQLVAGRSSALFALLAGVSLVIVARTTGQEDARLHRRRLVVRAGLVAAIGLLLGLLDSGVAVILVYYGVLFCCALPVLRWRAPALAWLALAWGLASPVLSLLLRPLLPATTYQVPSLVSLADPWQLLTELLLTGYYPVLTWATYLFAGMAVGRLLVPALGKATGPARESARPGEGTAGPADAIGRSGDGAVRPADGSAAAARRMGAEAVDRRVPWGTLRVLLLVGAWTAVLALVVSAWATRSPGVRAALLASWDGGTWDTLSTELRTGFYGTHPEGSWWWLAVWAPHSGSVVDLAHTTGAALLVLGTCLLLVRVTPVLPWRVLAGAGAMTLTLYSVHVLVLGSIGDGGPLARGSEYAVLLHSVAAVLVGAAFAAARLRGPLERWVREVTLAVEDPQQRSSTRSSRST